MRTWFRVETTDIDTTVSIWGLIKGLFSSQPYNVQRFWSPAFADLLARLLREQVYDIVQLEGSYMSLYSAVIRQHSKARLVLRAHNVEHQIWDRLARQVRAVAQRRYLQNMTAKIKRFELNHLQDYDAIIPISGEDAQYYQQAGFMGQVHTINGAVDLSRFPHPNLNFRPSIAFLGSLEWLPNVEGLHWLLKEVWPTIARRHLQATLHVAGKGSPVTRLLPQADRVVLHGQVPDAAEFLSAHHIFVVPLHSGGGMRMKIVEAMGAGMCVLSTSIGAEGIAYTDGVDIVIADSAEAWIHALDLLLSDTATTRRIAAAGRALAAERYSTEALAPQFEAVYGGLLR